MLNPKESHSESLARCANADSDHYVDGSYPFDGIRKKYFLLDDSYINLNHGSFGAVPSVVFDAHVSFLREQESKPDEWFRVTYYKLIEDSRNSIAQLINASAEDVVLVENASAAVNSILRSTIYKVQTFIDRKKLQPLMDSCIVLSVSAAHGKSSIIFECVRYGH